MNIIPDLERDQTLPERLLVWDACRNVRDVGGYATVDGGRTRWGALVRSDDLCRLSQEGIEALTAYGIRTIIDLRFASELAMTAHPFSSGLADVVYQHLPFLDRTAITSVDEATSVGAMYVAMLDSSRPFIGAVMRAIAHAPAGGILVHCFAGKDRTGLTVALALALAGVPDDTIVADYALSDEYLQPLYEELLARIDDPEKREKLRHHYASPPEAMEEALAFLNQQTSTTDPSLRGVHAYLQDAGVSAAERALIRQRLRDSA